MKTLFFFLVIVMYISCTKEPIETTNSGNVSISLDYAFPMHSGDITTKDGSVYLDFYTKYIAGKVLTPRIYVLMFRGIDNNYSTDVTGKWGDKSLVSLPPGNYMVTGGSKPQGNDLCSDTCFLGFWDTLKVTQTSISVIVKAYYACSLILLDTTNVKSTRITQDVTPGFNCTTAMMKTEGFYHTFIVQSEIDAQNTYPRLFITERTNKVVQILLWDYVWELGKYYYFGNSDNSYILSPMISN
jgi:hypothetical protein